MDAQAVRTGRDERRRAILEVARDVFLREGYAAASMSAIAARVGGSKGTLYNYFASKAQLFAALVASECASDAWCGLMLQSDGDDPAPALRQIGRSFLDFTLSERALKIHRLVIAECGRFPELGQAFYEAGPRRRIEIVARWIALLSERGRLTAPDPDRAAMQFLELCKSGLHQKRLWSVDPEPSEAEKDANVDSAVRVFLAAYGVADPGSR